MIEEYKLNLLKSTRFNCLPDYKVFLYSDGMKLADRLKKVREEKGLTQGELAKLVGTTQQQINTIEIGKSLNPRNLEKIAAALNVDAAWLRFGDHEPSNVTPAAPSTRRIPVINYVQAGNPREIIDDFAPGDGLKHIYSNQELGDNAFALIIEGESMTPDFKEGDEVIIDPSVQPRPGSFVVAKCCGSERVTFKKYRPRGIDENGHEIFELMPLNEDYATIVSSSKNPCSIVGTMVEHRRYFR